MTDLLNRLPPVRGRYQAAAMLDRVAWFKVGGPADVLYRPADADDLCAFLAGTPDDIQILPIGVASNLLIRDGGFRGVVVRIGGVLKSIRVEATRVTAEAGALDRSVAIAAAEAGLTGLEFYVGIPGTIGGAVLMNAGAFGGETKDRLIEVEIALRSGERQTLQAGDLGLEYRRSKLPQGCFVLSATFEAEPGDSDAIRARMHEIKAERVEAQPQHVATGGSTFKNPKPDSAWKLIDQAGCRGLKRGGAMVSDKHCNFLVNTGDASAADLEGLGEEIRRRVLATSGVDLHWEIKRVGEGAEVRS